MNGSPIAYLNSQGRYILFWHEDRCLRFLGPYSLEYIASVEEWNHGYIRILAKYTHSEELIEDYIDIEALLEDLRMNPDKFLKPIKEVQVNYDYPYMAENDPGYRYC